MKMMVEAESGTETNYGSHSAPTFIQSRDAKPSIHLLVHTLRMKSRHCRRISPCMPKGLVNPVGSAEGRGRERGGMTSISQATARRNTVVLQGPTT